MKRIIVILFSIYTLPGFSQKIALLSHDFKKPIIYTDSVTVEQISSGYFAVNVNDFDTLVGSLTYLKNLFLKRDRSKMESWEFRAGNTTIKTTRVPFAYGDRYECIANSKFGEVSASYNFTVEKSNKKNAQIIEKMIKYIAENRTIFKGAYEIQPVPYNITIVKEGRKY
ncbi:MAG: hypothetical protein WBP16_11245 [Ferruginibacter sp.]